MRTCGSVDSPAATRCMRSSSPSFQLLPCTSHIVLSGSSSNAAISLAPSLLVAASSPLSASSSNSSNGLVSRARRISSSNCMPSNCNRRIDCSNCGVRCSCWPSWAEMVVFMEALPMGAAHSSDGMHLAGQRDGFLIRESGEVTRDFPDSLSGTSRRFRRAQACPPESRHCFNRRWPTRARRERQTNSL
ncbi:hypothetical protein XAB3213_2060002 [Xanthomonas citri pv. bilvae]|nr:hypothetical protein XAB3213_2060002 [Xanthomonas citri pv. bilvae]